MSVCVESILCVLFVQAGLDRHIRGGVGEVIAEYIKKQMKENNTYSTYSPHQVWKKDSL